MIFIIIVISIITLIANDTNDTESPDSTKFTIIILLSIMNHYYLPLASLNNGRSFTHHQTGPRRAPAATPHNGATRGRASPGLWLRWSHGGVAQEKISSRLGLHVIFDDFG